jgi:ubiquinone/menaquinone biosynthesis C-methylase UbiE
VLDLATGIGEPAVTAAHLVGSKGTVIATDLSMEMLAVGQKRAVQQGLENIEFRQMDAEKVDQLEGGFDAILCRWGLFFLPDLRTGLVKMRKQLVPGGRLVAAVFDTPPKVPALSLPMKVVGDILQRQPPAGPSVFSLSDVVAFKKTFMEAEFTNIQTEELISTVEFASADDFTQFIKDIAAAVRRLMSDQSPEKQAEIWEAITQAAGQFATSDGHVTMPMTSIVVKAQD